MEGGGHEGGWLLREVEGLRPDRERAGAATEGTAHPPGAPVYLRRALDLTSPLVLTTTLGWDAASVIISCFQIKKQAQRGQAACSGSASCWLAEPGLDSWDA